MPPCSPGSTSARRTCVAPDFVMQGWALPTSAMPGWVARSWSGHRCTVRICAVRICAWQSSTAQDLADANLEGVEGLTHGQLNRAHCNSGTKLPAGLTGVEDAK